MIDDEEEIIITFPGDNPQSENILNPALSSEVGDLRFAVSSESVKFDIFHNEDASPFFSVSLNAVDGFCTLYNIGDVFQQFLRSHNQSFSKFLIKNSENKVASLKVLLSDRIITGGIAFARKFPLMSSDIIVAPSYASSFLYFFPDVVAGTQIKVVAVGVDAYGSDCQTEFSIGYSALIDNAIVQCIVCPDILLDYINSNLDVDADFVCLKLLKFQCISGSQLFNASVYVIDDFDFIEFSFRNNFGLKESVFFHAESIPKVNIDAESAVMGHRVVQYDVEHSQSFSVEAINIPASEWKRVVQFISSRDVRDTYGRKIIISDISSEIGKSYDSLGSLKFFYRFDDDRLIAD